MGLEHLVGGAHGAGRHARCLCDLAVGECAVDEVWAMLCDEENDSHRDGDRPPALEVCGGVRHQAHGLADELLLELQAVADAAQELVHRQRRGRNPGCRRRRHHRWRLGSAHACHRRDGGARRVRGAWRAGPRPQGVLDGRAGAAACLWPCLGLLEYHDEALVALGHVLDVNLLANCLGELLVGPVLALLLACLVDDGGVHVEVGSPAVLPPVPLELHPEPAGGVLHALAQPQVVEAAYLRNAVDAVLHLLLLVGALARVLVLQLQQLARAVAHDRRRHRPRVCVQRCGAVVAAPAERRVVGAEVALLLAQVHQAVRQHPAARLADCVSHMPVLPERSASALLTHCLGRLVELHRLPLLPLPKSPSLSHRLSSS
mmetsp:Transcript_11018/g.44979  ORF Transcript_11018/g.44979 Transcript_11018/m.44979 type:complete len:374 (-) Transcript_11018:224-1345(-)